MFEALFKRGPKPVSNAKSVNVGLHGFLRRVGHGQKMNMYEKGVRIDENWRDLNVRNSIKHQWGLILYLVMSYDCND